MTRLFVPTAALALAAALSACGSAPQSQSSSLAGSRPGQQAPMSYIDGLPVIPLDPAGFRGAVQGPLLALVYFHRGQPMASQELRVGYNGYLGCTASGLTLGLVQDGVKVGDFPIRGTPIDRAGTIGNCMAVLPLGRLHEGPVGFYVYDPAGAFDSDFGNNFRFALNFANVIP